MQKRALFSACLSCCWWLTGRAGCFIAPHVSVLRPFKNVELELTLPTDQTSFSSPSYAIRNSEPMASRGCGRSLCVCVIFLCKEQQLKVRVFGIEQSSPDLCLRVSVITKSPLRVSVLSGNSQVSGFSLYVVTFQGFNSTSVQRAFKANLAWSEFRVTKLKP
eukprot:6184639-Pleurochrysis_carterae.AAC.3